MRLLTFFSLILLATPAKAQITVLELFTTHGCPSCIPADEIFAKITQEHAGKDVITLSCHITYFGPSDLTKNFCDQRHRLYLRTNSAQSFKTPQLVMNGRYDVTAAKEDHVRKALAMSQSTSQIQPIKMKLKKDKVKINLPNISSDEYTTLWLIASQKTQSGTNSGQPVTFKNIIRSMEKIEHENQSGNVITHIIDPENQENLTAILQSATNGQILAAGKAP